MDATPVSLTAALRSFEEVYSPRIVTRVNDYDVKIAHASGARPERSSNRRLPSARAHR